MAKPRYVLQCSGDFFVLRTPRLFRGIFFVLRGVAKKRLDSFFFFDMLKR